MAERMLTGDLSRRHVATARWFDGEPVVFHGGSEDGTARDEFVARAFHAVIAASFGEITTEPSAEQDNPRDAVLTCAAQAAAAVTRGDEELARDIYKQHLARWPVDVKVAERHLRRFLTLGYVLSDELRERWDSTDLGPSHRRARAAGRAFLQARQGDLRADLPHGTRPLLPAAAVVGGTRRPPGGERQDDAGHLAGGPRRAGRAPPVP